MVNTVTLKSARRAWHRLDGLSPGRLFLIVAGPLFGVYLATATWSTPVINDTYTNALSSWNLGTRATFYLDEHVELADYFGWRAWIVPAADGSPVSMYPPGVSLFGAPFYAAWPVPAGEVTVPAEEIPWGLPRQTLVYPEPPAAPAVIAAAFATAAAAGLLGLVFARLGPIRVAVAAAYLAGLGTAAWSVAADQLWQHGPAMMWIALALLLLATQPRAAGFALGAAIITRPPVALIAAATGLYRSWTERKWKPAFAIGTGAGAGFGLYLLYNRLVFGEFTISAGYGEAFESAALRSPGFDYLWNLFMAGFSVHRGLFIWSPFLLLLLPGLVAGWKVAPAWVRGSAVGGVAYLLVQYKVNRYTGGFDFPTYRYPLEAITALAPLLFLAHRQWVARRPRAELVFLTLALASVALHLLASVGITPLFTTG